MRLSEISDGRPVVEVDPTELHYLIVAVNETLGEIEDWEFHTRTGSTTQEAKAILEGLTEIQERLP